MPPLPFFAADYQGPAFALFGPAHLSALALVVIVNLLLLGFRNANDGVKATVRWILAILLIVNEIAWHYWNYAHGLWNVQTLLPLHLCSLMVWAAALMLLTKSYRTYEFVYFLGIGSAVQALATPGIGPYGFPHFVFFQYLLSHGVILTAALFMTFVEWLRPTWRSLLRVFIWTNIYVVIIYFVNQFLGSNYLLINHKPPTASLLDLLPDGPLYIVSMEVVALVTCFLLYLPFALHDWRERMRSNKDNRSRLDSISK